MSIQPENNTTIEKLIDGTIMLHNPSAPTDMQTTEAGRLVSGTGRVGFQPVAFAVSMSADVLRAIADLVEQAAEIEADQ